MEEGGVSIAAIASDLVEIFSISILDGKCFGHILFPSIECMTFTSAAGIYYMLCLLCILDWEAAGWLAMLRMRVTAIAVLNDIDALACR